MSSSIKEGQELAGYSTALSSQVKAFQPYNIRNSKQSSIAAFNANSEIDKFSILEYQQQQQQQQHQQQQQQQKQHQDERNIQIQNLLIGESSKKQNQIGQKTSQNQKESKGSIGDSTMIEKMMHFNKNNNSTPLKRGNIVQFKSSNISTSDQIQQKYQHQQSSQKEAQYPKSASDLNSNASLIHSSSKLKQQSQQSQSSAVSNHFFQAKKISSQVTLKTIINLNHRQNENTSSLNNRGGTFIPLELQNNHQPSQNVIYVKDRFIDTRDQEKRKKKKNNNYTNDSDQTQHNNNNNNYNYSTAITTPQMTILQNSNQKHQNILFDNHTPFKSQKQLQQQQSSSQQVLNEQSNKLYSSTSFKNQYSDEEQISSSPSLTKKSITIMKNTSSTHQPSRMKFITVTKISQKPSSISLTTTPQSKDQKYSDFPQIRGNTPSKYKESQRPLSSDSPPFKQNKQLSIQIKQNQPQKLIIFSNKIHQELQNNDNSSRLKNSDNNIAKQLTGEKAVSSSIIKNPSHRKLYTQTSMNQYHNLHEPLNSNINLNAEQQTFLQRSTNLLSEVFPKGVNIPYTNKALTIGDFHTNRKSHPHIIRSLKNLPNDLREGTSIQKSMKRLTFNLNEKDEDSDQVDEKRRAQQNIKQDFSYLKDNSLYYQDNTDNLQDIPTNFETKRNEVWPNCDQLIKNFNGEIEEEYVDGSLGQDSSDQIIRLSRDTQRGLVQKKENEEDSNHQNRDGTSTKFDSHNSQKIQFEGDFRNKIEEQSQQSEGEDDLIQTDLNTVKKYQNGIDIEKEIMQQKIKRQRTHQQEVYDLISTIQNNAIENHNNEKRMQRSQNFNFLKQKSKIMEDNKIQKKKEFEENLQQIKEKNEYKDQNLEKLEIEFQTGGKFNQKNYNNLKINKTVKRSKQQLAQIFQKTIKLLQRLNIPPSEVVTQKVFSQKPFEKDRSHEFFVCVKANNFEQVSYLLKVNRYFVYEYDYLFMTPLHWACKRGFLKITQLLVRFNSDLEAEDMIGRTPLFFAIESNFEDVIEHLLVSKANPYKTKYADYAQVAKTYVVSKMLSVCRRLHWAIKLNPNPNKSEQWRKEVAVLYTIRQQQYQREEEESKKKKLGLI